MKIFKIVLVLGIVISCLGQPIPAPGFNISMLQGAWVVGYPNDLGNYQYTFCTTVNFSEPKDGMISYTLRSFFAPVTGDFDKWGWWEQSSVIYYDEIVPANMYLDPELIMDYYVVGAYGPDYISITTPSGFGGSSYLYFLYLRNHCSSNMCKNGRQNLGCLSTIPLAANFDPAQLLSTWYIIAYYASPSQWQGAQCAQFTFNVVKTWPPLYGTKIQHLQGSSYVQDYATTCALDPERPGFIFQYNVPPLFVNYFDGNVGVLITGTEDAAYFISKTPTAITPQQLTLFQNQVKAANMHSCPDCKFTQFSGCK